MSKTANESEAREMILEAYNFIETAINIKEDHYAVQKWMSILLDSKSAMEGMKSRIQQLYSIKKHMLVRYLCFIYLNNASYGIPFFHFYFLFSVFFFFCFFFLS